MEPAATPRCVLGVFAKQPVAGQVKTRLAAATSAEFAAQVARASLEDSLDRSSRLSVTRWIAYAPAAARDYFTTLAAGRFEVVPQGEGDLGARLEGFFMAARDRGFERIVAIGADSPTLPTEYVTQAFARLESHDVVLGPACDGGYYLVGLRGSMIPTIFAGIPWSTSRVLDTTVARVQQAGASLALLPPWYDVDTIDDWAMLSGHIRAMRQSGLDPEAPRLEQLVQQAWQPVD